eukprot:CAMPEP_0175897480 /NCGR_PEP_ID=MMETSP0108-20121206/741_1 /TAXON_ID=195067 ORGANISM="Goniomonas pacifica, Strain CCMP1869" /NCGR_SAMPLE_ID=MMETSP0108 /ASSEMBLY_ACC=CAM_ASM_000204 /LENGTH=82 /DNA_ID=CAMNT_0017218779 /DNA_START=200 /DNA_END=448 /DNA_ORIENTATION=-
MQGDECTFVIVPRFLLELRVIGSREDGDDDRTLPVEMVKGKPFRHGIEFGAFLSCVGTFMAPNDQPEALVPQELLGHVLTPQ